jgi:dolichol-phosphate mannosyltransferase
MKVVVVIPTYNERDNIAKMIDALALEFPKIKNHKMELLVVDDTSPDKTYEVVQEKMKKYKWVHLFLNPGKMGLGPAYVKGFRYAMNKLNADFVMEFDGDFQHRPDQIKDLVNEIDNGYEYIIGSRYIKGGSIPKEWGVNRKLMSVLGNLVARIGLLMPQIHDLTTGFKLTKVDGVLDKVDLEHLYSKSFAYKLHILAAVVTNGAKVKEVPIQFMARTSGESKIVKNEMMESLKVIFLFQIHNPKIQKLFKFAVVGFIGFIVNFVALRLFRKIIGVEIIAWILSTELAIMSNFTLNNLWTFRSEKIEGINKLIAKFLQFNLTSAGALIIQSIAGPIGTGIVGTKYDFLVLGFVVAFLVLPYNYFMYNRFIWKK